MSYKDGANCFLEQVSEDLTVLVLDYKLSNSNVALEAILIIEEVYLLPLLFLL